MVGKLRLLINGSKVVGHGNYLNLTNHVLLALGDEPRVIETTKVTTDQDGFPLNTQLVFLMMFQYTGTS